MQALFPETDDRKIVLVKRNCSSMYSQTVNINEDNVLVFEHHDIKYKTKKGITRKYVHLPTQRSARSEGIRGRCLSRAVMHWPPAHHKYHQLTTNTWISTTNNSILPSELCFHYFFTLFLQFCSVKTCRLNKIINVVQASLLRMSLSSDIS